MARVSVDDAKSTLHDLQMLKKISIVEVNLINFNEFRKYRQISNINCTKSQNLNVSCLVLQLSL